MWKSGTALVASTRPAALKNPEYRGSISTMDDNKPKPVNPTDPTLPEPQPFMPQIPDDIKPAPKKPGKKIIIVILVVLVLLGAGAGVYWYLQTKNNSTQSGSDPNSGGNQRQETPDETTPTTTKYTSKLWPDLSFDLPDGWTATEPEDYDESTWGEGSASGQIKLTDGKTTLMLALDTVKITGFEGSTCYEYPNIVKVTDTKYRFVRSGEVVYENGFDSTSTEWKSTIEQEGEFTTFVDTDKPNYCNVYPFLETYSSTKKQVDYPETPYGWADNEYALAWLSVKVEGDTSDDQLAKTDSIIKSLSGSAKIEQ